MTRTFQRFAAGSAVVAAASSLTFTIAFAVVVREGDRWAQWVSWTTLLAGALCSLPVMTALHRRLAEAEPEFALLGFVVGVGAAFGAATHAAYEWSVLANTPETTSDLPSAIDPRGFMTFAVTGLALCLFGWLILRTGELGRSAGQLGIVAGALLLVVFVGRLTVLDPNANVIRLAALVSGLVLVPGFYALVGRGLLRADAVTSTATSGRVQAAGVAS
jgi:hypothetical protein